MLHERGFRLFSIVCMFDCSFVAQDVEYCDDCDQQHCSSIKRARWSNVGFSMLDCTRARHAQFSIVVTWMAWLMTGCGLPPNIEASRKRISTSVTLLERSGKPSVHDE